MMIIVSLMLLNEGMLQETKIITLPIYNTEFRIYSIYISGPPSEEKNPPSSGSAYGLGKDSCILCISSCMRFLIEYADGVDG